MKPTPLNTVADVMNARIFGADETREVLVSGASVDTRTLREGDLFFAFRGTVDGADFAGKAIASGASAVVADRRIDGVRILVVEDLQKALQQLASWNLRREDTNSPVVVGITGSVGKTTTKDALAAILRASGKRVFATEGNFNNELGLPLTVLAADERTEILVLEMGATHRGNIRDLCDIANPSVGVLTAIAPAHLESFGSLEGLAATKGELADSLPKDGSFVYPVGVPREATSPANEVASRISFASGSDFGADLFATDVEDHDDGLRFVANFRGETAGVNSPVFGTHLVHPLLAAIGGAISLGVDLETAARGVARLKRTGMRGDVYSLRNDILVYDDSYNAASPTSVAAVLRYGAEAAGRQNRHLVVVLGGMFELGPNARAYHREIGSLLNELDTRLLVCVGDEARWYTDTFEGNVAHYEDARTAAESLHDSLEEGDYVLVKGSRGVGLDTLTHALKERLALV